MKIKLLNGANYKMTFADVGTVNQIGASQA